MTSLRDTVRRLPVVSDALSARRNRNFEGSQDYWERRYASGGTSGTGSSGRLAEFKAQFLNEFVRVHRVTSVIELGCGDGNQLALAAYPRYLGLDVSPATLSACRQRFDADATKSFVLSAPDTFADPARFLTADLAISLDVVYHLVERDVFEAYLHSLFGAAQRFVIVYSSDHDEPAHGHVRHRAFSEWVADAFPQWQHTEHVANPYPYDERDAANTSFADFHVYGKTPGTDQAR
ncbi:MAG TPA: methyltransferase [Acidimicrobiia bacterium]